MIRLFPPLAFAILMTTPAAALATASESACVTCHARLAPGLVADWLASRHAASDVGCADCHGGAHTTAEDAAEAAIPTPATCGECHAERIAQFSKGKHAAAGAAMKAMPTAHWQPMAMMEGQKGCGGCHKIGLKSAGRRRRAADRGGMAEGAHRDARDLRQLPLSELRRAAARAG